MKLSTIAMIYDYFLGKTHFCTIWVKPSGIKKRFIWEYRNQYFGSSEIISGRIVGGDWDKHTYFIESSEHFKACYNHWVKGIPWEDTPLPEILLQAIYTGKEKFGFIDAGDVIDRFKKLDQLFEQAKYEKKLRSSEELSIRERLYFLPQIQFSDARNCNINKSIFTRQFLGNLVCLLFANNELQINIDRDGNPVHIGNGRHRLAMAKILDLPLIPVKLGAVHPEGYRSPYLLGAGFFLKKGEEKLFRFNSRKRLLPNLRNPLRNGLSKYTKRILSRG